MNAAESMIDSTAPKKIIKVNGYMDNETTVLRISDEGTGIPPENLNKIFDFGFTTKDKKADYSSRDKWQRCLY